MNKPDKMTLLLKENTASVLSNAQKQIPIFRNSRKRKVEFGIVALHLQKLVTTFLVI